MRSEQLLPRLVNSKRLHTTHLRHYVLLLQAIFFRFNPGYCAHPSVIQVPILDLTFPIIDAILFAALRLSYTPSLALSNQWVTIGRLAEF